MQHSATKIHHSFQRALATYDNEATVQKEIARKLVAHLSECGVQKKLTRVFEFGCGTGFLSRELIDTLCIEDFFANDLIAECEHYLLANTPMTNCDIHFLPGDVEQIEIPNDCELICSASCIQWSADPSALLNRLNQSLTNDGWLAISSFAEGHFKELAQLETPSKTLLYWPKEQWLDYLANDFDVKLIHQEQTTILFDSVKKLLLHLRLTGVNGNSRNAWTQKTFSRFICEYRDNFEQDNKVPLSYSPIYIVARKKTT